MNVENLLPDNWEMVVTQRTRKLYNEGLKNLRVRKIMLEGCEGCPMLRTIIGDDDFSIWVFTVCMVKGNKCIKQYPHRIDNKEFK